jgi:peptidoglycan DL-endopeptidase CwlO
MRGYPPPPPPPRSPAGGALAVLVVATMLAALAVPHAAVVRSALAAGMAGVELPRPRFPLRLLEGLEGPEARAPRAPSPRAGRAVAFALAQRGKPYRWGAQGPRAFDCSGLTWAAWRAAGVAIPRTAAGQLAGLPPVRGGLRGGDLLVYASSGSSRRHVAMVVRGGRMVEAPARGLPVRVVALRGGWLGAVRPGGGGR